MENEHAQAFSGRRDSELIKMAGPSNSLFLLIKPNSVLTIWKELMNSRGNGYPLLVLM